jgi:glycosyltransferase 2 family protein
MNLEQSDIGAPEVAPAGALSKSVGTYVGNIIAGIVLSGAFLWLALHDIDLTQLQQALAQVTWGYLLWPFLFWAGALLARVARWRLLLGNQLDPLTSTRILSVVFVTNALLPFRLGEVVRLYLVQQQSASISGWTILTTVLTETILDFLAMGVLFTVALPFLAAASFNLTTVLLLSVVVSVVFAAILLFAHRPQWALAIADAITRLVPPFRIIRERVLEKVLLGIAPLAQPRLLLLSLAWTVAAWGCSLLAMVFSAPAFLDFSTAPQFLAGLTMVLVATSLGSIVPFTIAGVGPFEAAFVYVLGLIGVAQPQAMAFGLVLHGLMLIHFLVWGIFGLTLVRWPFQRARST